MKKIIAAFDGLTFSNSTKEYAIYLAKQANAHLVGVFMDGPSYLGYKRYLVSQKGISENDFSKLEAEDKILRDGSAEVFEKACQHAGLQYSLHHDHNIAIHDLKHESVYSDLLIIDSKETLTHYEEDLPTRFIRELLTDVQCPVLVVPKNTNPLIKSFYYMMAAPRLCMQ